MRLAAIATVLCTVATAAHADGYYYEQSFGLSSARGAPMLGTSLHLRLGIGYRYGDVSIEPWFSGDLTFERDNASFGILGGDPASGHSDLAGMGLDGRYTAELPYHLEMYVRGGPRWANGDGALKGYSGFGIGAGTGIQIKGKVRLLGFLWAPLFFIKRGPKVMGALFLDQGVDWYALHQSGMSTIATPILSTNLGFAIGTDF